MHATPINRDRADLRMERAEEGFFAGTGRALARVHCASWLQAFLPAVKACHGVYMCEQFQQVAHFMWNERCIHSQTESIRSCFTALTVPQISIPWLAKLQFARGREKNVQLLNEESGEQKDGLFRRRSSSSLGWISPNCSAKRLRTFFAK